MFTIEGEKELQIGRIANEKYQYLEAFLLSSIEIWVETQPYLALPLSSS